MNERTRRAVLGARHPCRGGGRRDSARTWPTGPSYRSGWRVTSASPADPMVP